MNHRDHRDHREHREQHDRKAAIVRLRAVAAVVLSTFTLAATADGSWRVTPTEITKPATLGWNQPAASTDDLSNLRFQVVVDNGARVDLQAVTCGPVVVLHGVPQTAPCSAPLPALHAGPHALALIAIHRRGTESARSPAIFVNVAPGIQSATSAVSTLSARAAISATSAVSVASRTPISAAESPLAAAVQDATGRRPSARTTETAAPMSADSPHPAVRVIADGFVEPSDLALLPDGRILVLERGGTVRIVNRSVRQTAPALDLARVTGGRAALLGAAIDPDFARTHFVYLVHADGEGFHVARYREALGTLGDRVEILDGIPSAATPTAALRFGPDGKLYVALDDGGDPSTSGDLGSYSGKVLRLNADGSAPADQPGYSPVFVPNLTSPRALAWSVPDGRLWIAEGRTIGAGIIDVVEPGSGTMPKGAPSLPTRPSIVARFVTPEGHVPFSVVSYRGTRDAAGSLLMTLPDAQLIVRLTIDATDPTRVAAVSVVAHGEAIGPAGAMAIDPSGLVYVLSGERLLTIDPATGPLP